MRRLNGDLHMQYMRQLYVSRNTQSLPACAGMTRIIFSVAQDVSRKMFLSLKGASPRDRIENPLSRVSLERAN